MRFSFVSLLAAVALVAACETAPEAGGGAAGAGGAGSGAGAAAPSVGTGSPDSVPGPAPGSVEELVQVGDRVFFDFDKYDLTPDARDVLRRQATWLNRYPQVTIVVEGHCDERGTREYNLALGERRANSVRDYLVALGVSPGRVRTISYGEERPVALGSNEAAWAQNRRGVTSIASGAAGS